MTISRLTFGVDRATIYSPKCGRQSEQTVEAVQRLTTGLRQEWVRCVESD